MKLIFIDLDSILEFIRANGYKDFMTYFMIVAITLSFVIYLINYIRKEMKNDKDF